MLHLATDGSNEDQVPPSSPIRRLVQPNFPNSTFPSGQHVTGAEFAAPITTEPESLDGQGIKREAFSPNYFKKFFVEEKELGRGGKGVVILVKHQLDGVSLGMNCSLARYATVRNIDEFYNRTLCVQTSASWR